MPDTFPDADFRVSDLIAFVDETEKQQVSIEVTTEGNNALLNAADTQRTIYDKDMDGEADVPPEAVPLTGTPVTVVDTIDMGGIPMRQMDVKITRGERVMCVDLDTGQGFVLDADSLLRSRI